MTIFVYENKRLYSVHKTSTFAWPKRSHGSKINSFDFLQFFQDAIFVFIHIYILLFVISIPFILIHVLISCFYPPSRLSNATLQHISKRIPRTKEELLEINGIGK